MENLLLTQYFTSFQNENEKPISGLLPVQFESPQFACNVVLQHESEGMGFLTELISRLTGCNEVRWRPGEDASLALPFSNLRSSGSKCTVLKNVRVTLLGYFGAPRVIRRPGNCAPLPLHYAPADLTIMQRVKSYRCLH